MKAFLIIFSAAAFAATAAFAQTGSSYNNTQFRGPTGASTGSSTTYTSPSGSKSTTYRDSSGRTTGTATSR